MSKPLILRCACGVETLDIDLLIEKNHLEGYLTFAHWWDQNRTWRERLVACWTILRGKSHYFDAIELDREDLQRVHDYLAMHLQQNVHFDFSSWHNYWSSTYRGVGDET